MVGKKKTAKKAFKTIQGYIVKEEKTTTNDEETFSDDDDDDFYMAGDYVKRVSLRKTRGMLIQIS